MNKKKRTLFGVWCLVFVLTISLVYICQIDVISSVASYYDFSAQPPPPLPPEPSYDDLFESGGVILVLFCMGIKALCSAIGPILCEYSNEHNDITRSKKDARVTRDAYNKIAAYAKVAYARADVTKTDTAEVMYAKAAACAKAAAYAKVVGAAYTRVEDYRGAYFKSVYTKVFASDKTDAAKADYTEIHHKRVIDGYYRLILENTRSKTVYAEVLYDAVIYVKAIYAKTVYHKALNDKIFDVRAAKAAELVYAKAAKVAERDHDKAIVAVKAAHEIYIRAVEMARVKAIYAEATRAAEVAYTEAAEVDDVVKQS